VKLTDEGAEAILADSEQLLHLDDHVAPEDHHRNSTMNKIMSAASQPEFSSVNVISYLREAWMSGDDDRLRVTFDSCCEVYRPNEFHYVGLQGGRSILEEDRYILELKFNVGIPRWICDLIAKHGIRAGRFSKYAAGVEVFDLAKVGT
jgi:hypothetical protein